MFCRKSSKRANPQSCPRKILVRLRPTGACAAVLPRLFTVVAQVGFASILGMQLGYGFDRNFLPHYLMTYCRNFQMALPLQLFLAGPLARFIFRSVFLKAEKPKTLSEVQQVDEEILEKTV